MANPTSLSGKVAVVTGAASGIGRATAELLVELGAKVHLVDINKALLGETASALRAAGGRVTTHVVDVADPAQIAALANAVYTEDQAVDLLHNNAGIGVGGRFADLTLEDIQRTININLLGTAYGIHYFLPRMKAQGRPGHIVNTASGAGLFPIPLLGTYCAAKHGVVALTEALDAELAGESVSVSVVCPGVNDTPILRNSPQRSAVMDVARIDALAKRFAVSPRAVALAVVDTLRSKEVVVVVAPLFVTPQWLVHRLSPRLSRVTSRASARFAEWMVR